MKIALIFLAIPLFLPIIYGSENKEHAGSEEDVPRFARPTRSSSSQSHTATSTDFLTNNRNTYYGNSTYTPIVGRVIDNFSPSLIVGERSHISAPANTAEASEHSYDSSESREAGGRITSTDFLTNNRNTYHGNSTYTPIVGRHVINDFSPSLIAGKRSQIGTPANSAKTTEDESPESEKEGTATRSNFLNNSRQTFIGAQYSPSVGNIIRNVNPSPSKDESKEKKFPGKPYSLK